MEHNINKDGLAPQKENKMGVLPEGKLLFQMALPLSASMLIQALYNIVDSIFVSRLSENALTAVTLAYPMYMLMISVAVGTGVGINSLISRRLGAKRFEEANRAADNGLFVMILTALAFVLFGLFGAKPFIYAYTDIPELQQMGTTYLSICATFCIGVFIQVYCERIMQSQGKNVASMLMQLVGAVFNLIFDPILIFGLFGFPKMGVAGAAVATVGGQILASVFSLCIVFSRHNEVQISVRGFRPDREVIRAIYRVGLPSIIMQSITTVMQLALNAILISFTATAVAVSGAYFKIQSFVLMPLFGMTNASMSIMAYNYGARRKDRLMRTWRLTMYAALVMMGIAVVVFRTYPDQILSLFDALEEMLAIGRGAFRRIPLHLPVAAVVISISTVFQSVGNGVYSMVMSLLRQLVVLVPAAWLMSALANDVSAVWWSFLIAEGFALCIAVPLFVRTYRNKINPLDAA